MMREPEIVVPEVGDEFAASLTQSLVVRTALMARVRGQIDPANARITDRGNDRLRIIRATVADDEDLEILHRLPEHAADRVRKNAAPVVRGDDDADARGHALIMSRHFRSNDDESHVIVRRTLAVPALRCGGERR